MNGYSLMFAVITILAIAVISGAVVLGMMGGIRVLSDPPWRRRRLSSVAGPHRIPHRNV